MRLSLAVGFLMLAGKTAAYTLTGSAAILSDAAESVIHVAAVAFAAFSLRLSQRPARADSPFGFERISFFSAGFEGGMILLAAVWIIATVVEKWRRGLEFQQLGLGTVLTLLAALINVALGWYLVSTGKRTQSLILVANGRHVLTDSWTSFGVVGGLVLVLVTGWKPFDPLVAIAVALNILWSAWELIRTAVRGLLDLPDPEKQRQLQDAVSATASAMSLPYHRLRFRDTGGHLMVGVHLLFPRDRTLGEAHALATEFEARLAAGLPFAIEVMSHLESIEDHEILHPDERPEWT